MTIKDIAHPELQQRHETALLQWFSEESSLGPVPLENTEAFVRPVRQVTIGLADIGRPERGNQFLAMELAGPAVQTRGQICHVGGTQAIVEVHGAPARRPDLDAALADLAQAVDEAREDGFDPPPELALRNADRFLRDMYAHRRCRFEVYPTPDREVAIYALERERSVLVLCGPDGSVRCSVNLNGKHCRAYCDPAWVADRPSGLPTGFLREALTALDVA
jgi:hypothetical protein